MLLYQYVVLISEKVSKDDLIKAREEYGDYVKIVVDVETGALTIGGEWHADGEKLLLNQGSRQSNLWGGGVSLKTGEIDYTALINIRAKLNPSHVIMDEAIRGKFDKVVKEKLSL